MDKDIKRILEKYQAKIQENVDTIEEYNPKIFSREYLIFREEALSRALTIYERLCNFFEKIIKIRPKEKDAKKLQDSIEAVHLKITPEGAASFSLFVVFITILISLILGGFLFFTTNNLTTALLWPLILVIISLSLVKPLTNIPNYLASKWRLKASNQMVLCVLYIVMYMRHTSNLEHAIKFSADHIGNPLALDLRKVFWDIEKGRFSNIKQSLDYYLVKWRNYSLEFVESFHLIQGSLYESSED
ncbi:MAG: hypothetical protein AABX55_01925, partial [Nanoarchaeota archaeon]